MNSRSLRMNRGRAAQKDSYRFTLLNNEVTNLQEFKDGRWVGEEIDQDESWSFDGTNLIEREIDKNKIEITTYSDPDGDNIFSKVSKVYSPISDGNSYGL